jgi:two-component system, OmpR family, response regulator
MSQLGGPLTGDAPRAGGRISTRMSSSLPKVARRRLLVVEDDAAVGARLVRGLRVAGYDVELAVDGEVALDAIQRERFDAVVLDLGLPRVSGGEILAWCAQRDLVVLVLTADAELPTRLACLEQGAADFLAKPFFLEELVARLALRLQGALDEVVAWEGLELSVPRRLVMRNGAPLPLTRTEVDILIYLVRRAGRPISRQALRDHALVADDAPTERTIDSHVAHLRRKLGSGGRAIETVWGIGYRFTPGQSGD